MSSIGLNTGLKALLSARYMLDTIGHNIANANTPGYSRQRVQLGSARPVQLGSLLFGTGVDAGRVERSVDELLGRRIQGQRTLLGSVSVQREGLGTFETLFAEPGENGLSSLLDGFFAGFSQLSTAPTDSIRRTGAVQATEALTARFRDLSRALEASSSDAMADVSARVSEVNELASEIVRLNQEIGETESVNLMANDLRDRRDQAVQQLSQLVDATTVAGPNGAVRVLVAGNTLVGSTRANAMSVVTDQNGKSSLRIQGADGEVPVQGGEIGGLLRLGGELAQGYRARLDQLARGLILETNRVHTTGLPSGGAFDTLTSASALEDFDQDGRVLDELLSNAGLPFDVGSGSLYVNVSDDATGALEKHKIDISSTHTTVQDFLDELNALAHLSAAVDANGRLRISADSGFGFDFSRRMDVDPDPEGLFGGTRPTLGTSAAGPFALADGDTLDFTVDTTGTPVSFSITLAAADFAEISAATADELAAALNADPQAQARGLHASAAEGRLFVQTLSGGVAASFSVDGGTAVGALGWSSLVGTGIQGQANAVDARLSGAYTGDTDERFVFRPTADGTIGTTAGLQVEVFDRAGNRVTTLDVGAGYLPGTELEVAHGVRVRFGLGELSATHGDLFAADAVADSDSSDILVALGLNTLLTGSSAEDIAVRADIADDPSRLAVSLTGEAGDGGLLLELLGVERTDTSALDGTSVGRFWGDLASDVGFEAALADSALASSQSVLESLEQRQAAISGVNVDEELVDLLAYEQSFAAAAQYLTVVNQLGQELLSLIG
ncbi:MAG: flagellar hook-associated protein FlgK [Planctomycetes bacterium]|nr:flagellar hook-associated protein FlgK [Planctomycetota bacterium]